MKTAIAVAMDVFDPNLTVYQNMVAAIEADREQRAEEDSSDDEIRVGDVVRLTGASWAEWDLLNEIVVVDHITADGEPQFHRGRQLFVIFYNSDPGDDYRAEKVAR